MLKLGTRAAYARVAGRLLLLGRPLHGGRLAVLLAHADLHSARLALLRLGDPHLENALVERRADGVGVDALRQRQRAREAPEGPLDAIPAALVGLVLGAALARQGERV